MKVKRGTLTPLKCRVPPLKFGEASRGLRRSWLASTDCPVWPPLIAWHERILTPVGRNRRQTPTGNPEMREHGHMGTWERGKGGARESERCGRGSVAQPCPGAVVPWCRDAVLPWCRDAVMRW